MRVFLRAMYLLAAVPVLVGVTHVVLGPASDVQLGARLPPAVLADAVLDSQNRFYGMAFVGYGALVLLSLQDLDRYANVFRIVLGFIALGGVARLISVVQLGLPPLPVIALIGVELLGVPLILWWHARVLEQVRAAR
jgi:hypothetical protein